MWNGDARFLPQRAEFDLAEPAPWSIEDSGLRWLRGGKLTPRFRGE
jgi:hypothetical protein